MEQSQKFIKRRRFLMVLPLLAFPFVCMIFWVLGGGKGTLGQTSLRQAGLNMTIPGANFSKDAAGMNKLSIYEQARLDSLKYEQDKRLDPYLQFSTLEEVNGKTEKEDNKLLGSDPLGLQSAQVNADEPDQNENAVREKLAELTRHLEQGAASGNRSGWVNDPPEKFNQDTGPSTDVERLEALMEDIHEDPQGEDEMKQISQVLDKILDVQHPERVTTRLRELRENEIASAHEVLPSRENDYITLLESGGTNISIDSVSHNRAYEELNRFYTLDEFVYEQGASNAIDAVIHGEQIIVSGGIVKMRLLSNSVIDGNTIPANTFVFGTCSANGERLKIDVNSIGHDTNIFPVNLKVYDLDGQEGLFVPGALTRDAAKKASSQMFQDVQLYSMEPSLTAQAASAGIQAATGLMSRKAKLVKFTVKSGYRVLLRDTRSKLSNL